MYSSVYMTSLPCLFSSSDNLLVDDSVKIRKVDLTCPSSDPTSLLDVCQPRRYFSIYFRCHFWLAFLFSFSRKNRHTISRVWAGQIKYPAPN